MRIARVFPTRTSMAPVDKDAYFSEPDMFTPNYDEIHISVTFTWDIPKAERLATAWGGKGKVKIGGVAINGESREPFKAGMYLKKGITITSRGCPNKCSFCFIRDKELIEFDDFPEGNIVQDNNILATSDRHWDLVIKMLKNQRGIEFKGGLEARRVTQKKAEDMRGLSIKSLWLACDHKNAVKPVKEAISILNKAGFTRNHLMCYCLIGKDRQEEENRLMEVLNAGAMPFAQLYRNEADDIKYSHEWKKFQREWSRPAIIRSKLQSLGEEWMKCLYCGSEECSGECQIGGGRGSN